MSNDKFKEDLDSFIEGVFSKEDSEAEKQEHIATFLSAAQLVSYRFLSDDSVDNEKYAKSIGNHLLNLGDVVGLSGGAK